MDKREKAIEYLTRLRDCKLNELKDPFLGKDYGLAFVISYMACSTDNITAKVLSEKMDVSMSRMTTLIQKLEDRELVYRIPSKEDGRVSFLFLTDMTSFRVDHFSETKPVRSKAVIAARERRGVPVAPSQEYSMEDFLIAVGAAIGPMKIMGRDLVQAAI